MDRGKIKAKRRWRRHRHIRKMVHGTPQRPRLAVFRSINHIYGQIIDDESGQTLVACSTLEPAVREGLKQTGNQTAAEVVGRELAKKAVAAGVTKVAFDRAGFRYHGRIRALAEAARKVGLEF